MKISRSIFVSVLTAAVGFVAAMPVAELESRDTITPALFENLKFYAHASEQEGYITLDSVREVIVLSLRGTYSLENYIEDIEFLFVPCDDLVAGCLAEAGFYGNFLSIYSLVLPTIEDLTSRYPSYKLIITGHSLGAAVATLAAGYLREAGYPCDLYTYGSPRVGNDILADFVTAQQGVTARTTHLDDPVPRLPPLLLGYRHTSPEYWLADGTATTTDYNITDVVVCAGDANLGCNGGTGGFDVTAHGYYFYYISGC
ncbi:hypothetical protein B7494_g8232 [Chlorociboria aeruginascens]|nr:hypothetical protein B7494_g8232 [Chlorociboria aeruginascens]